MSATTMTETKYTSRHVIAGAIASLGGGLLFGIMMGMMNMLPMVGMLIGQENSTIGFIVHMGISAILGAMFGVTAKGFVSSTVSTIIAGGVYGIIWWVLGALILMPLLLGMNDMVFVIEQPQWFSLIGHLIYGVIAALLYKPLLNRL